MARISIWKLVWGVWIWFKWFESISNGSILHSNASNPFRVVKICIRMLKTLFEWFEFAFECFESLLNRLNLDSNASNPFWMIWIYIRMLRIPFWMVWIWIRMLRMPFEWFEIACFESCSKGYIRMLRIPFESFKFGFECFQSHSTGSNLHSNALNPFLIVWICTVRRVQICIKKLRIWSE